MQPHCLPLERLHDGKYEFGDCGNEEIPNWINKPLLEKGQKFAQNYLYGIFYTHLISLVILLGQTENRRLLYHTSKSETSEKACKRYLATLLQVKLWYDEPLNLNPNEEDSPIVKSIKNVRSIHRNMGNKMEKMHPDFSKPNVSFSVKKSKSDGELWTSFLEDLLSSDSLSTNNTEQELSSVDPSSKPYYFSQFDMMITQWSFMALPIMFTKELGLHHGSDNADLEGFIHLWAVIGKLLGMKDEYNICLVSSVEECQVYCFYIFNTFLIPSLYKIDYETEVMWKALIKGMADIVPNITTERIVVALLEDFMKVKSIHLRKQISWKAWTIRTMSEYIFRPFFRFKWFRSLCNYRLRSWIGKASLKHNNFGSSCYQLVSEKAYY